MNYGSHGDFTGVERRRDWSDEEELSIASGKQRRFSVRNPRHECIEIAARLAVGDPHKGLGEPSLRVHVFIFAV